MFSSCSCLRRCVKFVNGISYILSFIKFYNFGALCDTDELVRC